MCRLLVALALASGLLVGTVAAGAAAPLVPFHATTTETFTATVAGCTPAPSLCITTAGAGQGARLGRLQEASTVVSDLASTNPACPGGGHRETRTTVLTAANGDQLTLVGPGFNCSTGATTATAADTFVVTGGTGRLSGASGSGTVTATIDLARATAVVTVDGTLSTP